MSYSISKSAWVYYRYALNLIPAKLQLKSILNAYSTRLTIESFPTLSIKSIIPLKIYWVFNDNEAPIPAEIKEPLTENFV